MLSLNGCATNIAKDSFCLIYEPVYISRLVKQSLIDAGKWNPPDVDSTVKQVTLNNGKYEAICSD